jgi:hypothetical protein
VTTPQTETIPKEGMHTPSPRIDPNIEQLVHDLRSYERVARVTRQSFEAHRTLEREHVRHTAHYYETQRMAMAARGDVLMKFAAVYRTPSDAVRRFEADAVTTGHETAIDTLAHHPERYGALHRDVQHGWRRMLPHRAAEEPARHAAHAAAMSAITMLERQAETRAIPVHTTTMTYASQAIERYATELRALPDKTLLERRIAGTLQQLDPSHQRAVEKMLSPAQSAALRTFRASVRDIVLGNEGRER